MSPGTTTGYPTILQAIGLVVLLLLLQVVLALPIGLLAVVFGTSLVMHPVVLAVVNVVTFGAVLAWGYWKAKVPRSDLIPLAPIRWALLLPMGLTVLGASILLSEADNVLRVFLPIPGIVAEILQELLSTESSLWGSILLLVIVAPITEELLFRGLILRGLLGRYGATKSILVSAALFAVLHLNPWQLMPAMLLGVLLGWWYVRTRSLIPCLFGHALNNSMIFLIAAIPGLDIPGYTGSIQDPVEFQPVWFDLIGIVLAGLGLVVLIRGFRETTVAPPLDVCADAPTNPQQ